MNRTIDTPTRLSPCPGLKRAVRRADRLFLADLGKLKREAGAASPANQPGNHLAALVRCELRSRRMRLRALIETLEGLTVNPAPEDARQ